MPARIAQNGETSSAFVNARGRVRVEIDSPRPLTLHSPRAKSRSIESGLVAGRRGRNLARAGSGWDDAYSCSWLNEELMKETLNRAVSQMPHTIAQAAPSMIGRIIEAMQTALARDVQLPILRIAPCC